MISKWKVANFKSIREETELEFRPLTIFAGSNSSGKSTLIQSILLMAQSLAPKVATNHFVLNGTLTNLGQFDDLKSNDGKSKKITIKCIYHPIKLPRAEHRRLPYLEYGYRSFLPRTSQIREITCEVSFDANSPNTERHLNQLHPRLNTTQLSCKIQDDENPEQNFDISINRSNRTKTALIDAIEESQVVNENLPIETYRVKLDPDSMKEVKESFLRSAKPVDCQFRHFLPDELIIEYEVDEAIAQAITQIFQRAIRFHRVFPRAVSAADSIPQEVVEFLQDSIKKEGETDIFKRVPPIKGPSSSQRREEISIKDLQAWMNNLTPSIRREVERNSRKQQKLFEDIHEIMKASSRSTDKRSAPQRLPESLRSAARMLESFFNSSLKYLGPLRDSPKQLYPIVHAVDPYHVGLLGEHSASILELHKDKLIEYIPSKNFQGQVLDHNPEVRPLEIAVNDWLRYLEVADSVNSKYQSKWGREIKVNLTDSKHAHDLTHVGVGVSQVLPILVMCLLADPDSTLVLEQPELHLHPKVQTLLGDFFLSMALCNKQCIVETHSEYLIDRLRLRIVLATEEQELNSKTKIYFVDKTAKGSTFKDVEINEYGAINNWPHGFFDQSQQEAQDILIAATKKRKVKQKESRAKSG